MRNSLSFLLLAALLSSTSLWGCGGPDEAKPVSAAPASRGSLLRKPMTPEEKIAAIERSSAPQERKAAAIARLRSSPR